MAGPEAKLYFQAFACTGGHLDFSYFVIICYYDIAYVPQTCSK